METENKKAWGKEVYLHVCNGGATFSIDQSMHGARIKVETSSYGNCISKHEITTNKVGLKALRDLLNDAIENVEDQYGTSYDIAYVPSQKNDDKP